MKPKGGCVTSRARNKYASPLYPRYCYFIFMTISGHVLWSRSLELGKISPSGPWRPAPNIDTRIMDMLEKSFWSWKQTTSSRLKHWARALLFLFCDRNRVVQLLQLDRPNRSNHVLVDNGVSVLFVCAFPADDVDLMSSVSITHDVSLTSKTLQISTVSTKQIQSSDHGRIDRDSTVDSVTVPFFAQ
jgi:hypothetical protein